MTHEPYARMSKCYDCNYSLLSHRYDIFIFVEMHLCVEFQARSIFFNIDINIDIPKTHWNFIPLPKLFYTLSKLHSLIVKTVFLTYTHVKWRFNYGNVRLKWNSQDMLKIAFIGLYSRFKSLIFTLNVIFDSLTHLRAWKISFYPLITK